MSENERYLYHQGKWTFLLNDDDHTAWIKRGHIGRGKHYRVPSFVMVHGVRYTITSIEIAAYNCPNTLHHLVIPDSVTYIDEDCFKLFKNLRSVHIGKGVEHLPNWNFYSPKLGIFTIDKGNPHLKMVDGMVLSQDGTTVEREIFPKRIRIIPEGVTHIAPLAFWYDDKMESVQLPSTIQVIGVDSFLGCSNAVTQLIDIPNNQPDEFYNFGGISKEHTGLPVDIFLDQSKSYQTYKHPLWIYIRNGYSDNANYTPISVEDLKVYCGNSGLNIYQNDLNQVLCFILLHKQEIYDIANEYYELSDFITNLSNCHDKE